MSEFTTVWMDSQPSPRAGVEIVEVYDDEDCCQAASRVRGACYHGGINGEHATYEDCEWLVFKILSLSPEDEEDSL